MTTEPPAASTPAPSLVTMSSIAHELMSTLGVAGLFDSKVSYCEYAYKFKRPPVPEAASAVRTEDMSHAGSTG